MSRGLITGTDAVAGAGAGAAGAAGAAAAMPATPAKKRGFSADEDDETGSDDEADARGVAGSGGGGAFSDEETTGSSDMDEDDEESDSDVDMYGVTRRASQLATGGDGGAAALAARLRGADVGQALAPLAEHATESGEESRTAGEAGGDGAAAPSPTTSPTAKTGWATVATKFNIKSKQAGRVSLANVAQMAMLVQRATLEDEGLCNSADASHDGSEQRGRAASDATRKRRGTIVSHDLTTDPHALVTVRLRVRLGALLDMP